MSKARSAEAEKMFDDELRRLGEEVRWASGALQRAQDRMRAHADNHDGYVAYKMAILELKVRP